VDGPQIREEAPPESRRGVPLEDAIDDLPRVGRFLGRRIWACGASRPAAESLAVSVAGGRNVMAGWPWSASMSSTRTWSASALRRILAVPGGLDRKLRRLAAAEQHRGVVDRDMDGLPNAWRGGQPQPMPVRGDRDPTHRLASPCPPSPTRT
jgi:hypothetical protein